MTLHQLRIFLAVAQSTTLTRASKLLGLAQPSLSQQLARLEESIGARLFDRAKNRMVLTVAGRVLLRHAQSVIREVTEAEADLREFAAGRRSIVRIAGLNSVIKALLPDALAQCGGTASGIDIDIHEAAPGEVLEMLYSRQADIGLIAADSVAQSSVGFRQFPVIEDPYVFAVPKAIVSPRSVTSTPRRRRSGVCSTVASSSISGTSIRCASRNGISTCCRRIASSRIAAPMRWRSNWCARASAYVSFRHWRRSR